MSLVLVHDSTNSKVKALECDANGLLKVDKVDVSALATDATLASLNGKVVSCDTGSISGVVAVSAVSGSVACTHASLPLPSGASTAANQATGNTSLASLAGCVSANKVAVQSSAPVLAVTDHYLWGSASGSESVLNELDAYSDSVDVSTYDKISVYGSSSNLSDEFEFQVSHDNSNWFEITSVFVQVDYATGHYGFICDAPFKYARLKKKGTGTAMMSDDLWAILSGKK
tara:strand:+ start:393 stop:1079 length:687 start_codon:yes stop_codon:yes gene_type:complete